MVKGICRQVIVAPSPDPALFEQAIFILKDGAAGSAGVTDQDLIREAKRMLGTHARKPQHRMYGFVWASLGGLFVGAIWIITALL